MLLRITASGPCYPVVNGQRLGTQAQLVTEHGSCVRGYITAGSTMLSYRFDTVEQADEAMRTGFELNEDMTPAARRFAREIADAIVAQGFGEWVALPAHHAASR